MSQQPISLSPDLKRLRDDGYDLEIRYGHLLVKDVPYVNVQREIKRGTLVSELNLAGDVTQTPKDHVAHLVGEYPCDHNGAALDKIRHPSSSRQNFGETLTTDHSFSSKPLSGSYKDYYDKMTTYVAILSSPARQIDPAVTARMYTPVPAYDDDSVFKYIDTASSRAGIGAAAAKVALNKIAIIGVGGTGSYVLDLVAKTPVKEIHLFDGDRFLQHNAFRAPGAPSMEELRSAGTKAHYWAGRYAPMRNGIIPHEYHIDASNVAELQPMDCVFITMDGGDAKRVIVENLEAFNIPFIDTGMGVELVDTSLRGVLRVTTSTPQKRDHFRGRVSFAETANDDYERNIQIADLNALNAALTVIKWKKLFGFYFDHLNEHHTTYAVTSNNLVDEDRT